MVEFIEQDEQQILGPDGTYDALQKTRLRMAELEAENALLRKIIDDMDSDQKLIASAAGIEDWRADEVVNKLSTSECEWCSEQKRISG